MGKIWEKFKTYVRKNLNKNYIKISAAFGALLIWAVIKLGTPLRMLLTGGDPDWGMFFSALYDTAAGGFLTVAILSIFGREESNGTLEEPKEPEENV